MSTSWTTITSSVSARIAVLSRLEAELTHQTTMPV